MSSEKNSHHFCFWHPPSFDFNIVVILSPGVNDFFLPDRLKKNQYSLPALRLQVRSQTVRANERPGLATLNPAKGKQYASIIVLGQVTGNQYLTISLLTIQANHER